MKFTDEQKEEFKNYISDKLMIDYENTKFDSELEMDLGADDIDFLEITMDSEIKYKVKIDDDAAERCLTVSEFIDLIEESPASS